MQTKVDNLVVYKIKTVPADLNKLHNVVVNNIVKALCMINWLSKSMLMILKHQALVNQSLKYSMVQTKKGLDKKIQDIYKNVLNARGMVKKTDYNTKTTGIVNKIPAVTGLVTTTVLNTKATKIENKIPDIINLAKKAALITKQRLKVKYLKLLIWLPKLLSTQKPQRLNTKYLIPQVLYYYS